MTRVVNQLSRGRRWRAIPYRYVIFSVGVRWSRVLGQFGDQIKLILVAKASPQRQDGLEGMEIDALVLYGSPKTVYEDDVHPSPPAIHTIGTSASRSTLVKACDINWLP